MPLARLGSKCTPSEPITCPHKRTLCVNSTHIFADIFSRRSRHICMNFSMTVSIPDSVALCKRNDSYKVFIEFRTAAKHGSTRDWKVALLSHAPCSARVGWCIPSGLRKLNPREAAANILLQWMRNLCFLRDQRSRRSNGQTISTFAAFIGRRSNTKLNLAAGGFVKTRGEAD